MVRNRPPNVPKQPDLFYLLAYISSSGDVVPKDFLGVSIGQINSTAPATSRYAVARDPYARFWLIDLYDLHHDFGSKFGERILIRSHKKFATYEAAVAAALLGWEEGDLPSATT